LENRLRKRGTESDEIISKRLFAAQQELKIGVKSYDYILSNKTLNNSLFELTRIVHTHRILNSAPNIIY
jgi:guanylate kinase